MDAADFYTGFVADAYAQLKSSSFEAERYARFVRRTGEPALELGCGDGEPLLSLVGAGLAVEGVDSSEDMLDRCRANAVRRGMDVVLHQQRMEQLDLGRRFASIYLAGPTFNLLPDDQAAERTLRSIRDHLSADGAALIPLWIPDRTPADELGAAREAVDPDGTVLRYTALAETYDVESRTRTTSVRYQRLQPGRPVETIDRDWTLHWYTPSGFRDLSERAGLAVAIEGAVSEPDAEFSVVARILPEPTPRPEANSG